MLTIVAIGLVAGLLIGAVGVGGVIVAPALTYLVGFDVHTAVSAALLGFGFSGLIGTLRYQRAKAIEWSAARVLVATALPASVLGAYSLRETPELLLKCILGTVVVVSGLNGLLGATIRGASAPVLSRRKLGAIGVIAGYGSVITGTGGPLILVPMMVWLQQPVLLAIGLAQVIQIPISISATATNVALLPDASVCIALSVALAIGSWVGTYVAQMVSQECLRRVVSCLLVVVGCAIVINVWTQLSS